jgi:hypothetical protein
VSEASKKGAQGELAKVPVPLERWTWSLHHRLLAAEEEVKVQEQVFQTGDRGRAIRVSSSMTAVRVTARPNPIR